MQIFSCSFLCFRLGTITGVTIQCLRQHAALPHVRLASVKRKCINIEK